MTSDVVDNVVMSSCKLFLFLLMSDSVNHSSVVCGIARLSNITLYHLTLHHMESHNHYTCNRVSTYCNTNSPQSELFSCSGTYRNVVSYKLTFNCK